MKKLLVVLAALAALARPGGGVGASARQLHDQPLQRASRCPGRASTSSTSSTWRRSPPSRPGGSTRRRTRRRIAAGAELTVDGRPVGARPAQHGARPPARRGRAAHDAARGAPRRPARCHGRSSVSYHDTNYADRIGWKEIVVGAKTLEPQRRAARLSEGHAPEPARRDGRSTALAPDLGPGHAARARQRQGARGARPRGRLRLHAADRPPPPVARS